MAKKGLFGTVLSWFSSKPVKPVKSPRKQNPKPRLKPKKAIDLTMVPPDAVEELVELHREGLIDLHSDNPNGAVVTEQRGLSLVINEEATDPSPDAQAIFEESDRRLAFEGARAATQRSILDPEASFWACVEWRGRGKYRQPCAWHGYMNGLWVMSVRQARRGLFHPSYLVNGRAIPMRPRKTSREAQEAAFEAVLVPESRGLPWKPKRRPKTEAGNQAAKVKAEELQKFGEAFNRVHRAS